MSAAVEWLTRAFGGQRSAVAMAYRNLLGRDNPSGRLIVADMARYCNVGVTSFVPGDPHQTAFREGARDAFLHLVQMAGLRPDDFPELMKLDG